MSPTPDDTLPGATAEGGAAPEPAGMPADAAGAAPVASASTDDVALEDVSFEGTPNDATSETPDAPAPEPELTADQRRIVELQAQNEDLSKRLRQYAESVDRVKREFDATRARLEREHARQLSGDLARAAEGLLSVLDNLDKALASAEAGGDLPTFLQGVGMVRGDLEASLAKLGICRFEAVGERFDPERHQAMTTLPVSDPALDGRVVESFAAGAVIGEEVVRPAVVVVGKFVEMGDKPS